ncbi:tetratricopeptide repeat protein, partial [bacterium]|nr:tetratricopeptide repeat protein [bacterium]
MSRSDSDEEKYTRGIFRTEGFLKSGLLCGLLLLSFLAVQGHSQDAPQELAFARKLFDDGLYVLAAEQYHDFALANPSSPMAVQARFMVGESYFANGDLAEAEEVYREFLAQDPRSHFASQAWVRLGTCLSKAGHFSDAAAAFSRSGRLDPDGPWAAPALFGMADALRK